MPKTPSFIIEKFKTLTGHNGAIYAIGQGIDPGVFYSSGNDGMIVEWKMDGKEDGIMLAKVSNSVYSLLAIPETHRLIAGHNYEGIHIIDMHTRKETGSLKLTDAAIFDMKAAGKYLFVATGKGEIIVVDMETMQITNKLRLSTASCRTLEISGNVLFSGFSDHMIRAIALSGLQVIKAWKAHNNSVFTLRKDPSGQFLLSGGRDAHLNIWDLKDKYRQVESIVAHMYTINTIDFNPEGTHFVSGSMDKTLKLWDARQFKLLKVIDKARFGGHVSSVNKLVWSNYKNRVISCSDDRTISLWDIKFLDQ